MAILPSDVPTRLVTATMYFVNEDSVDPDTKPEYTVVTGSVVFTASPKTLRMPSKPAILVPLTFEGVFNSEGQLIPKDGTGVGMELIVTNSPLLNPTDWTWTCTFNLKVAGTQNTVNIDSFSFQLPAGTEPLDLVSLMPVSTSGGVLTVQGPKGDPGDTVAEARLAALETAKVTINNTVGRRAFAWDAGNARQQMIYGDTGRRDITSLFNGTAPSAATGITAGSVYLTRVGRMVELVLEGVTLPPGQSATFVTLGDIIPSGFLPPSERDFPLSARLTTEGANGGGLRVNRITGRLIVYLHVDGETVRVSANWLTEDAWPTTLPGTAVGTIPA